MQEFAYFQEQDSEQFAFYKIPKVLFTDPSRKKKKLNKKED